MEYVTKENVIANLERFARDPYHESHYIRDAAVNTIRRMEAADVAPVRHGRWIDDERYVDGYYANCSECGWQLDVKEERGYHNYCPNCGAKMDGGNKDER